MAAQLTFVFRKAFNCRHNISFSGREPFGSLSTMVWATSRTYCRSCPSRAISAIFKSKAMPLCGYYISCNADTIVAEPTTLTGSIGIFGMMPNAKGLTEKLGVSFDVVKTNPYADFGNLTRPMNDGEKGLMQMYVNNGYELFLTRCSDGRGISMEELDKIAQGRVWTGSTAKELGLVDELGGLDKALEIAIAKAGVDAYTVMSYPKKEGFLESLMNTNPGNYIKGRMLNGKMSDMYRQFSIIENFDKIDRIQARVPFELNIQ